MNEKIFFLSHRYPKRNLREVKEKKKKSQELDCRDEKCARCCPFLLRGSSGETVATKEIRKSLPGSRTQGTSNPILLFFPELCKRAPARESESRDSGPGSATIYGPLCFRTNLVTFQSLFLTHRMWVKTQDYMAGAVEEKLKNLL